MRWETRTTRVVATVVVVAALLTAGAAWAAADGGTGDAGGASVVATEGGLAGGRLWLVHDGERARIYQPQPLALDDLEHLGLAVGAPAPGRLEVADQPTGSSFAVLPADGPDADLYLRVGDRLHLLTVAEVVAAEVERLPLAEGGVLDRLRPAG